MDFPKLSAASIDLTEGCNLACDYCFTWSDHKTRNLTIPMGKKIIKFFMDHAGNTPMIDWWGGEPLLRWNTLRGLTVWAQEEYDDKIQFNGTTNGLLYTPKKLEWLLDHHSNGFMISCDGVEEAHDAHRKCPNGKGSWKIVDKRMRDILKVHPFNGVRLSLSVENLPYFFESMQYFIEDLGFKAIAYSPVFESEWTDEAFELLREQFNLLIPYLREHRDIRIKHLDDACKADGKKHGFQLPCGAGRSYMGFSVDGFGYPCHRFNKHGVSTADRYADLTHIVEPHPHAYLNSSEEGLKWVNDKFHNQFIDYQVNGQCKDCKIHNITCNGICYAMNYDLKGAINAQPKHACEYYHIEEAAGRKLVNKLYSENVITVGKALTALSEKAPENEKKILDMCIEILKKEYTNGIR